MGVVDLGVELERRGRRGGAAAAQEQPGQHVVVSRGRDVQAGGAGAVHQRVELDRRAVVVGAHAAGARRHPGQDRDVVRARPRRVVRRRLGVDAAAAQLVEKRQLVGAIEAQAVDHDQEYPARQPRRPGILDRRRHPRERRLDLLEIEHERSACEAGLHRADRAEHEQGERRRHHLAGGCGLGRPAP